MKENGVRADPLLPATGYGTSNTIGSVVARSSNDVWAAGSFKNESTGGQSRTLLLHWDGTSWSIVPSPSPGESSGLSDIAFGPSGVVGGVGIYSEYPIDIYDGHDTLAQALTLGAGPVEPVDTGDWGPRGLHRDRTGARRETQ